MADSKSNLNTTGLYSEKLKFDQPVRKFPQILNFISEHYVAAFVTLAIPRIPGLLEPLGPADAPRHHALAPCSLLAAPPPDER